MSVSSKTAAELLKAAEVMRSLSMKDNQRAFLDQVCEAARTHAHPQPQLPPSVPEDRRPEGWWRAASKLAAALALDDESAQAEVRTAMRIAVSLAESKGVPPRLVYHYTSLKGLKGILKKQRIRATHFEYLNDPDELHYCRNLFGEEARRTDPNAADPAMFGEDYIASFSEVGDDLAQWRSYGDGGNGVAIGLVLESKFLLRPHWAVRWVKVDYSEHEHRRMARSAAPADLFELGPRMKRGMHSFEREWRLVVHTGAFLDAMPPVRFRNSKFGLTPYVELEHDRTPLPIQEVVLGPMTGAKAFYAVGLLLKSYGYFLTEFDEPRTEGVFIKKSTCRAQ
jgi:hypothetical protein